MAKRSNDYRGGFERFAQEVDAARERNLNTFQRNTSDNDPEAQASSNRLGDWSIQLPNDVANVGSEVYTAPTANPKRPRAYTIGYNHNTNTVVIVMRSGAWWQYNDVPVSIWLGLKNSASTNDYLPTLEKACSSHHAASIDALSEGTKTQFSENAAKASRIQSTDYPVLDDLFKPRE